MCPPPTKACSAYDCLRGKHTLAAARRRVVARGEAALYLTQPFASPFHSFVFAWLLLLARKVAAPSPAVLGVPIAMCVATAQGPLRCTPPGRYVFYGWFFLSIRSKMFPEITKGGTLPRIVDSRGDAEVGVQGCWKCGLTFVIAGTSPCVCATGERARGTSLGLSTRSV